MLLLNQIVHSLRSSNSVKGGNFHDMRKKTHNTYVTNLKFCEHI